MEIKVLFEHKLLVKNVLKPKKNLTPFNKSLAEAFIQGLMNSRGDSKEFKPRLETFGIVKVLKSKGDLYKEYTTEGLYFGKKIKGKWVLIKYDKTTYYNLYEKFEEINAPKDLMNLLELTIGTYLGDDK